MSELHAETVPFVRDTMLPQAAPPARQSGAVLWLRENLFSGPLNTILTLVGLAGQISLCQMSLAGIGALVAARIGTEGQPWALLLAAGAEVRNLGDVRWLATEDDPPARERADTSRALFCGASHDPLHRSRLRRGVVGVRQRGPARGQQRLDGEGGACRGRAAQRRGAGAGRAGDAVGRD